GGGSPRGANARHVTTARGLPLRVPGARRRVRVAATGRRSSAATPGFPGSSRLSPDTRPGSSRRSSPWAPRTTEPNSRSGRAGCRPKPGNPKSARPFSSVDILVKPRCGEGYRTQVRETGTPSSAGSRTHVFDVVAVGTSAPRSACLRRSAGHPIVLAQYGKRLKKEENIKDITWCEAACQSPTRPGSEFLPERPLGKNTRERVPLGVSDTEEILSSAWRRPTHEPVVQPLGPGADRRGRSPAQ